MGTHERQDNSGFPEGTNTKGILKESQLLQYSEFIDQKLIIKMGQKVESAQDVQVELVEKELESKKILDVSLAFALKKYLSLLKTK